MKEDDKEKRPLSENENNRAAPGSGGKLSGKVALITGGDNGVGRAVAELFAREGAEISISCTADNDNIGQRQLVEIHDKKCLILTGDQADTSYCIQAVEQTLAEHGGLDILVNNATDHPEGAFEDMESAADTMEERFRHSLLSTLFMTQSALFYLDRGGIILNTIPFEPHETMPQYTEYLATRFAIVNFTKTLAKELASKKIRVNAVAPDSVRAPEPKRQQPKQGTVLPCSRHLQPEEIAPSYLFLACSDSSLMTGQVLYPNSDIALVE